MDGFEARNFLISCSWWFIVRVVERFNGEGIFPTVEQIEARIAELQKDGTVNFELGIG